MYINRKVIKTVSIKFNSVSILNVLNSKSIHFFAIFHTSQIADFITKYNI